MKIAVVGAGIGGLTAALALKKYGYEVTVYERAPQLGEVGAGLQIGPSAVKVMRGLGLEQGLMKVTSKPDRMITLNWDSATMRHEERFQEAFTRFGAPYLTGHRADLHNLLQSGMSDGEIVLGKSCSGVVSHGSTAAVEFSDGSSVEADLVIGADGIRSAVRSSLWGEDQPKFTNSMCWRATVPIDLVPERVGPNGSVALNRNDIAMWLGPTGGLLWYPVRSGELLNIFAGKFSDSWVEESWSGRSSREEVLEAYAGWNPALLEVLGHIDETYKWGIFDRDPMKEWTKDRITLVGDAAHPMMPTLAQGAAISIEDGYSIARHLASHRGDIDAGLRSYETERLPRTSRVQLQARAQSDNNRKVPPPPQIDRGWIFAYDATAGA